MKKIFTNKISVFVYVSFAFIVISLLMYIVPSNDFVWSYILWNDVLAVIPLFCAMFASYFYEKHKKIQTVIFLLLWMLFFPNSPYMITDLKYAASYNSDYYFDYARVGVNGSAWLLLFNIAVAVSLGVLFGLLSLSIVQNMIKRKFGTVKSGFIVAAVIVISSFGVYIGRFARVNSWDIVRPSFLFNQVIQTFTPFMPMFILILSICTAMLYIAFRFFIRIFIKQP